VIPCLNEKLDYLKFTRVVGILYTQHGGERALRTVEYYWFSCKNQALKPILHSKDPCVVYTTPNPRNQIETVRRERIFSTRERRKNAFRPISSWMRGPWYLLHPQTGLPACEHSSRAIGSDQNRLLGGKEGDPMPYNLCELVPLPKDFSEEIA